MGALSFITRKQVNINTTLPVKSQAAVPAKTEAGLPEKRTPLQVELSDNARAIRDERWQFCYEVIAMTKRTNMGQEKCCQIIAARDHERYPLLCRAGKNNTSALTYNNCRHWLRLLGTLKKRDGSRDYNWDNVAALADRYTTGKQPKKFNNLCFRIFMAAYCTPRRLPLAVAYREVKTLFKQKFPDIVFPTIAQIRYQLASIPETVVNAGRYGIDWVEMHQLYMIIRDWSQIRPGQCYFADSRTFDQLIRVPDGDGWKAVRPDVTFIMDAKSWYCVAFETTEASANSEMIRNTFAQACVRHGRPEVFYVDNGRDYNKQGFTQPVIINDQKLSIIAALGTKLTNSLPYRGRAKTVERRFEFFAVNFDKRQGSYVGNSPANRPDEVELYYKNDNVMLLPTLGQFNEMLQAEIDKFHNTPHGGILDGKTPNEAFRGPDRLQRPPKSEKEVYRALLLPLPAPRVVKQGGCVEYNKVRWYSDDLFALTGKKVIIKTTYLEKGSIHAFTLDNKYICECTAQTTTHPLARHCGDDEDRAALAEQMLIQGKQRRAVLDGLKQITGGLDALALEDISKLEPQQLASGTKLIKLAEKQSVKGGTHHVKLLATQEQAAHLQELTQLEAEKQENQRQNNKTTASDRQAFDASFDKLMTANNADSQPEQEFAEFTL